MRFISAAPRGLGLLGLAVALALLAVPGAASAAGTLDQSQTLVDGGYEFGGSVSIAQTFTAGITGALDQVDVDLGVNDSCPPAGPLTVSVESVVGSVPSGVVLASGTLAEANVPPGAGAFVAVPFPAPARVVAGSQYAIVASAPSAQVICSDRGRKYLWHNSGSNPYAGGIGLFSADGVSWDAQASGSIDLAFRTYVTSDTAAPTTTIGLTPSAPDGANGWYRGPVQVTVAADDNGGSGIAETRCVVDPASVPASFADLPAGCPASQTVSTDGQHTVYAASKDQAANSEQVETTAFKIDLTAPTVAFSSHPASYTVDQQVTIACTSSDPSPGSGLASNTCAQNSLSNVPAYTLGLGPHTLSATATDNAGNSASAQTSYSVTVTIGSLCTLTNRLVQGSSRYAALTAKQKAAVDKLGLSTCSFLTAISPRLNAKQKQWLIAGYKAGIDGLARQGWLTPAQAATLMNLASSL